MWKQLQSFWIELRLRLKSMNKPWFYNRVGEDWLKSNKYNKEGY